MNDLINNVAIININCSNIIDKLNEAIDDTYDQLISNMTDPDLRYNWVCIKPNITYQYYYEHLKNKWDNIINSFLNQPNKCSRDVSDLNNIYQQVTPDKIFEQSGKMKVSSIDLENIILEGIATSILNNKIDHVNYINYQLNENFTESAKNLANILFENCQCQLFDLFKKIIAHYKTKYITKFHGRNRDEIIGMIRNDYARFKNFIRSLAQNNHDKQITIPNNWPDIRNFYMTKELDQLIPNEFGSMKNFFVNVISTYYQELHPVVWAQIFKEVTQKFFVELPYTLDEVRYFLCKHILLNSGPFILKFLQLIKPLIDPETATKYHLTKLTYPMLMEDQINFIMKRAVYQWDMYKILANYSASVGHVCKVVRINHPDHVYIIKIIKPLAVAQSCWEYVTLHDLYLEGSCEQKFIKAMLISNGKEMNLSNEKSNMKKGHKYYTANYRDIFNVDIEAELTTVQYVKHIIPTDTWYALAMTVAPGIPLSYLVENDLLQIDTLYRAKLHRCLDLLVFKFFSNVIKHGFYHGDLHAGNIFYSYYKSQLTLIDFGSVGHIDLYASDENTRTFLDIIVLSVFYNYEEILDRLTTMINSKCPETQIDRNSPEYHKLKLELYQDKIRNTYNRKKEEEKARIYERDIFSQKRIDDENATKQFKITNDDYKKHTNNIYSYLEYVPSSEETIVENRDELSPFTEILGESKSISLAGVLEKIMMFYAKSGVNMIIKFPEFYEFQKASLLLLGVLTKVHYNSYRMGIALGKALITWANLPELRHVSTMTHLTKFYLAQRKKFYQEWAEIEYCQLEQMEQMQQTGDTDRPSYYHKYLKYKTKLARLRSRA